MSSPSLPGIAVELVVRIFKSLPNCRAVAALNRTSRKFYLIWLSNAAEISDAVLLRSIDCYADAEELLRFQTAQEREWEAEESETDKSTTGEAADIHRDAYQELLERNKRFVANAFMVSKECLDLQVEESRMFFTNLFGPDGKEHRRKCFVPLTHIRYRIHSIVALSNHRVLQDEYLKETNLGDLRNMQDDRIWIDPKEHYSDWGYFRLYVKTSSARDPFDLIDMAYRDRMRGF